MRQDWKYKAYPQDQVKKLAARIKSEWLAYKDREKSTQTEFADRLDITQPALNQFLNGTTPISNAMIMMICRELRVDPKEIVKGLKFFEPFFDGVVTSRLVRIRYKIGAKKYKETLVTGQAIQYHAEINPEVDVYAVEVADDVYEPRYFKGEKLIVAAITPQEGDEAFIKLTDGKNCVARVTADDLVCLKKIHCVGCSGLTSIDHEEIEFAHKVVGMSK